MEARRALVAGLYGAVATGVFYGFSVYSVALKAQCGLSQSQLDNINTVPYTLGLLSPVIASLARPIGLRGMMLLGSTCQAVALCSQYYVALHCHGRVRDAAPILLVLLSCLTYTGNILVTSVAFPTPVLWWPRNRSQVTATVKSFVGLGGAAVAQAFRLLYGEPSEDPTALKCMLLWAGITLGCTSFGAALMPAERREPCAGESSVEPRVALHATFASIALLGVVATATPLLADGPVHDIATAVLLLLALVPAPLALLAGGDRARAAAVDATVDPCAAATCPSVAATATVRTLNASLLANDSAAAGGACASTGGRAGGRAGGRTVESARQYTLAEMLRTVDAWLLWSIGATIIGGGGLLATNLGVIIEAARAPYALITTTSTTFSTGSAPALRPPVAREAALFTRAHAHTP